MAKTCCDSIMRSMTTRMAIEVCWRGRPELQAFTVPAQTSVTLAAKERPDARALSASLRRLIG